VALGSAWALDVAAAAQSCPEVGFTMIEPRASGETRPVKFWRGGPIHVRRNLLTTTADIADVRLEPGDHTLMLFKFTPEAGARLEDATTGRSGLRLAFVADDEALLSITWEGEYGMGREGVQVSLANEGQARRFAGASRLPHRRRPAVAEGRKPPSRIRLSRLQG
jgi:hypothetical protein